MTLRDLIAKLQQLEAEHGDLPVFIPDMGATSESAVTDVAFADVEEVYSERYPKGAIVYSLSEFANQPGYRRGPPTKSVLLTGA